MINNIDNKVSDIIKKLETIAKILTGVYDRNVDDKLDIAINDFSESLIVLKDIIKE